MENKPKSYYGVMEPDGAYNRHARLQASGIGLALPFLEQAVRSITFNGGSGPVVLADYGSSQGKNSLAPMRTAIGALRARLGPDRPISVVHVDQAANDFNTLFDVLHRDPDRYASDDPNVFPAAVGRSFYGSVLPPDHVHLGWSSYAVVWLSRAPMPIPGHFIFIRSHGEVRAAFDRQGAEDWKRFLSLRAAELRPGGRLVVVLPGLGDDGSAGLEGLFDHGNEALREMVDDGAITSAERERMVLASYARMRSQLLAPFQAGGHFHGLTVEHCDLALVPDASWADYQRDGDKEALATRQARFFRSAFAPSLACALAGSGGNGAGAAFADRLEDGLKRRLANRPAPLHSFVQTMVLAKQNSAGTVTGSERAQVERVGTVGRP